jgi:hypothetical protein
MQFARFFSPQRAIPRRLAATNIPSDEFLEGLRLLRDCPFLVKAEEPASLCTDCRQRRLLHRTGSAVAPIIIRNVAYSNLLSDGSHEPQIGGEP